MWLRIKAWAPLAAAAAALIVIGAAAAADDPGPEKEKKAWHEHLAPEFGGHVRGGGSATWYGHDSIQALRQSGPYWDGFLENRLKNRTYVGDWGYFEAHLETVLAGGDTRRQSRTPGRFQMGFPGDSFQTGAPIDDDRRLMDLTWVIDQDQAWVLYTRLDRLNLSWQPDWGSVRAGRQALTWGNGLTFNPMDLFNPFAPTDIVRDYKVGDDLIEASFSIPKAGSWQVVYVPRRDPADAEAGWDQSSLGAKVHFAQGMTEFDLAGAKHYRDYVLAAGGVGYLGSAAWRINAVATFLTEARRKNGFLALVANIDYSWVWWEKNFYGYAEFHFNSLGHSPGEYQYVLDSPDLLDRLERGETFTIGRYYLTLSLRFEAHPLVNLHLSAITNVADPSGIVQPRVEWSVTQDLTAIVGANLAWGGDETEFGGWRVPATPFYQNTPHKVYALLTYYF
jgi:hypothetical protein